LRTNIQIPTVSLDGLKFCGLAWTFKLPSHKQTETSIEYARPFPSTSWRPEYILIQW
jgi:hypothetical protein